MAGQETRQWILTNPPHADPILEGEGATFKLVKNTLPVLDKDEVLVKVKYFSNDRKSTPSAQPYCKI